MLLKLVFLLSAIGAISPQIVEINCFFASIFCIVDELPAQLPADATWKFLCPQDCDKILMDTVNFPRFPRELWITHPQVTYLSLTGTDFEELAFGDFFNAAKLTSFVLRNNTKSMSLRDNCFSGASALNLLDIFGSKISVLEGGAFSGISLLTQLNMQNNEISHISNDHFRDLPNLRSLYLLYNTIETIEAEAFVYNTKLDYLNVYSNQLTELDLLLPFIKTESITLYGNQLTKVFLRSTSQEIDDTDNGVYLHLDKNKLTEIYIQPNFAVDTLILLENPFDRIDPLPALKSLKVLNLQRCEFRSLNGQRFADKYVNLKTLYLSGNKMTSFPKDSFAGLDKLETLALDINELTSIDFPRLESLTTLSLKNNSLTMFPYGETILDTFPALKDLDIRNNNFEEEYLEELVMILEEQGITVRWEPVPWMGS